MPIKWILCVVIVAIIAGAWFWRARMAQEDAAPESIVLLLQQPRALNAHMLADLLGDVTKRRVYTIEAGDDRGEKDDNQLVGDVVAGRSPHFVAQIGGTTFAVHNLPVPYMEDPGQASESHPDLRLRKAIRDHKAWLSMDILDPEAAIPEAYRVVARVLAELIGADCLALYHPPSGQLVACAGDETVSRLNSDDPVRAVFHETTEPPVIPVGGDPRLEAAEAEARERFPEFEAAFREKDGTNFAIKTVITAGDNSEHIWVEVDRISEGRIEGRLGNDPVDLGDLKLGSKVEVEVSRIEDWLFLRDGAPVGMFTVRVIQEIESERSGTR